MCVLVRFECCICVRAADEPSANAVARPKMSLIVACYYGDDDYYAKDNASFGLEKCVPPHNDNRGDTDYDFHADAYS